jgi:bacterioferritin-associated ferredoxin
MFVCICHALSENDVAKAGTAGARNGRKVFEHFGVKPECGRCVESVCSLLRVQKRLIEEATEKKIINDSLEKLSEY